MGIAQDAIDEIHTIVTTLKADGHALADRLGAAWDALRADLPKLADEAETDAEQVATTAETQGLDAAATQAEGDAVQLGEDAAHDVVAAVEGNDKPAPDPAEPTA